MRHPNQIYVQKGRRLDTFRNVLLNAPCFPWLRLPTCTLLAIDGTICRSDDLHCCFNVPGCIPVQSIDDCSWTSQQNWTAVTEVCRIHSFPSYIAAKSIHFMHPNIKGTACTVKELHQPSIPDQYPIQAMDNLWTRISTQYTQKEAQVWIPGKTQVQAWQKDTDQKDHEGKEESQSLMQSRNSCMIQKTINVCRQDLFTLTLHELILVI